MDCSFGAGKACDGILISWTLLPNELAFYKIGISTGGILPTGYLSVFRMQSVRCLGNGTKVFSNSNFIVATCSFSSVQNFQRIYASFPAKLQVFISYCSGSSFQTSINAANEDHAAAWTMLFSFSSLPALFYYFSPSFTWIFWMETEHNHGLYPITTEMPSCPVWDWVPSAICDCNPRFLLLPSLAFWSSRRLSICPIKLCLEH